MENYFSAGGEIGASVSVGGRGEQNFWATLRAQRQQPLGAQRPHLALDFFCRSSFTTCRPFSSRRRRYL